METISDADYASLLFRLELAHPLFVFVLPITIRFKLFPLRQFAFECKRVIRANHVYLIVCPNFSHMFKYHIILKVIILILYMKKYCSKRSFVFLETILLMTMSINDLRITPL